MSIGTQSVPQLLVSVRSPEEAAAAIAGGCGLLDVKEPARGSLGAADPHVVAAICEATRKQTIPLSVALGELAEWPDDRPIPALPNAVTFAKLGLSNCRHSRTWPRRWRTVRERFDSAANRNLAWIAVLYADLAADGPDPDALIDLAATTDCRGLLIDTFHKDGRRLFDHAPLDRLARWRSSASAAGLLFAVAGSLRLDDLPRLSPIAPDIIAVRGAACLAGDRTAAVCADVVRRLRITLDRTPQIDVQ